jgi:hypothetical protein
MVLLILHLLLLTQVMLHLLIMQKFNLGGGADLQIYHDGSDSYIDDAGAGNLWVQK